MKPAQQWVADYKEDKRQPIRKLRFTNGDLVRAIQKDAEGQDISALRKAGENLAREIFRQVNFTHPKKCDCTKCFYLSEWRKIPGNENHT